MAVGALVLALERLLERGEARTIQSSGGQRHLQLERLAVIEQPGAARELGARADEALAREQAERLALEAGDDVAELARIDRAHQAPVGAGEVMLDVGVEQPEGREQPGRRRHDDAPYAERLRHAGC